MDGERRKQGPPLKVHRDFARSRLEPQVMAQVYELVVPLAGNPAVKTRAIARQGNEVANEARSHRFAQGA